MDDSEATQNPLAWSASGDFVVQKGPLSIREMAKQASVSLSTMKQARRIVRAGHGLSAKVMSCELTFPEALRQANVILGIPKRPTTYQRLKDRVAELQERNEDLRVMLAVYAEIYEEETGSPIGG